MTLLREDDERDEQGCLIHEDCYDPYCDSYESDDDRLLDYEAEDQASYEGVPPGAYLDDYVDPATGWYGLPDPDRGVQVLNIKEESRRVDPTTGGAKGVKLERYDLIPAQEWNRICLRYVWGCPSEGAKVVWSEQEAKIIASAWEFWSGREVALLEDAAARAVYLMVAQLASDKPLPRLRSVPMAVMEEIARVYGFGASKYDDNNWKKGYSWGLSFGAMLRHAVAHSRGELRDPESGRLHLAHFVWHCMTLLWFVEHKPELDSRDCARLGAGEPKQIAGMQTQICICAAWCGAQSGVECKGLPAAEKLQPKCPTEGCTCRVWSAAQASPKETR